MKHGCHNGDFSLKSHVLNNFSQRTVYRSEDPTNGLFPGDRAPTDRRRERHVFSHEMFYFRFVSKGKAIPLLAWTSLSVP